MINYLHRFLGSRLPSMPCWDDFNLPPLASLPFSRPFSGLFQEQHTFPQFQVDSALFKLPIYRRSEIQSIAYWIQRSAIVQLHKPLALGNTIKRIIFKEHYHHHRRRCHHHLRSKRDFGKVWINISETTLEIIKFTIKPWKRLYWVKVLMRFA